MTATQVRPDWVIDVRAIPPVQRHPLIFGSIDTLEVGEALVIVADHEPRPLHYQLTAQYADRISWEYLEQGPELWRVRIERQEAAGCGCCCGS